MQILTQKTRQDAGEKTIEDKIEELGVRGMDGMVAAGTKVQILTESTPLLSLLDLLVQKYKY